MTKQQEQDSAMVSDETLMMLINDPGVALGDEIEQCLRELQSRRSAAPPSEEVVEAVAKAIFENAEHRCSWADADKYFFKLDGQKASDFYKVMGRAAISAYHKATEPRAEKDQT